MANTARYDSTDLTNGLTTGNAATIYNDVVWHTSENRNIFTMLEGDENSFSPIIRFDALEKRGGETFSHDFMNPFRTEPHKQDFDLHTYESKFSFETQTAAIIAWREAIMVSELEKQKPAYDIQRATVEGLSDYHALKSGTFIMKVLLHQTWTGADSSGALYDASTGTTGNEFIANQILAGDHANVTQLGDDDVFTGELIDRAIEVAYSGERRVGDQTFRMKQPVVGGRQYKGVVLMTQFQFYDLKNNDPNFREEAIYTLDRGKSHPMWVGWDNMFEYKGCLCIVLSDELEEVMKFTTSSVVWDEGGTTRTPAVRGATAVFLAGRAVMRVPANRDKIFEGEDWDGTWFQRVITGRMEGVSRIKITEAQASAKRDYGTITIHTAASHHNIIAGP